VSRIQKDELLSNAETQYLCAVDLLDDILSANSERRDDEELYAPWGGRFSLKKTPVLAVQVHGNA
jgi:hypothetical protein